MIALVTLAALLAGESTQVSPASSPDETAAQAAEEAGRIAEAFGLYMQALHALPDPPPPEVDLRLRERIVRLAPRLDPPPEVPEDAERRAVRGRVLFGDAHDAAGLEASAAEFRKAVRLAPFLTAAAFNLALVQEKLEQYDLALGNMRLHLLAVVDPAEAQQVRAKVYELELRREQGPPPAGPVAPPELPAPAAAPTARILVLDMPRELGDEARLLVAGELAALGANVVDDATLRAQAGAQPSARDLTRIARTAGGWFLSIKALKDEVTLKLIDPHTGEIIVIVKAKDAATAARRLRESVPGAFR